MKQTYKIVLIVLCGAMIFGFLAYLIQPLNLNITHTVMIPAGAPGTLTSERYTFRYWLIFLFATQGLLIFTALAASMFSGKNKCLSGFWFVFFVITLTLYVIYFVVLSRDAANCNGSDEANNICNHPLRCCDPAFNGNLVSGCYGSTTCLDVVPMFPDIVPPITIDKLGWSSDFVWLFWTTFVFVILDIALFIVLYCIISWEPSTMPDDPFGRTFTTTGGFAIDPGFPLAQKIFPEASKMNTTRGAQKNMTKARKRIIETK